MNRRLFGRILVSTLIFGMFAACTTIVSAEGDVRVWGAALGELPYTYTNKTVAVLVMLESDVSIVNVSASYIDIHGNPADTVFSLVQGDNLNGTWRAVMSPEMVAEKTEDEISVKTHLEITAEVMLRVSLPSRTIELPINFAESGGIVGKAGFSGLGPLEPILLGIIPIIVGATLIRKGLVSKSRRESRLSYV